jgi:hypothetical protein
MAFRLPTFNLTADIYQLGGTGGTYGIPNVVTVCNLTPGRRTLEAKPVLAGQPTPAIFMELLLPKLTDIRANFNGAMPDIVEVPSGSKRFYQVVGVDDIGKGFLNEHRLAMLLYQNAGNATLIGGPFPAPVPMP